MSFWHGSEGWRRQPSSPISWPCPWKLPSLQLHVTNQHRNHLREKPLAGAGLVAQNCCAARLLVSLHLSRGCGWWHDYNESPTFSKLKTNPHCSMMWWWLWQIVTPPKHCPLIWCGRAAAAMRRSQGGCQCRWGFQYQYFCITFQFIFILILILKASVNVAEDLKQYCMNFSYLTPLGCTPMVYDMKYTGFWNIHPLQSVIMMSLSWLLNSCMCELWQ